MRLAVQEFGEWVFDPELVRLRRQWINAFREWEHVVPTLASVDDELTNDQRARLQRYHDAETAYFERCRALTATR